MGGDSVQGVQADQKLLGLRRESLLPGSPAVGHGAGDHESTKVWGGTVKDISAYTVDFCVIAGCCILLVIALQILAGKRRIK
jgi:hypothetical protein